MPWPPAEAPSSPGSSSPGLGSDVSSLPAALLARAKTSPQLHLKASPSLPDFAGVKPPSKPVPGQIRRPSPACPRRTSFLRQDPSRAMAADPLPRLGSHLGRHPVPGSAPPPCPASPEAAAPCIA